MALANPFTAILRWFQGRPNARGYDAFVYQTQYLPVQSSNVSGARYFYETKQLILDYHNGQSWAYSQVSAKEAIDFANAGSKGQWVWSNIRSRGTVSGQKKPSQRLK